MADGNGYRSKYIGRQNLEGPAMERIAAAKDTNTGEKVDNEKWYAALIKNRALLDKIHERLIKD